MAVTNETLYLKFDKHVEVKTPEIYLKDVAKIECTNSTVTSRVNAIKLMKLPGDKNCRYVFSVLKIIELIHEVYPQLEIQNVGESDVIIAYEIEKHRHEIAHWIKIVLVCILCFAGSAFSIMAFNNDVGVTTLFDQIYEQVMGVKAKGFTVLEFTYSIGLIFGILIFFNHVGGRKITMDPTPLEVEMRLYEDDVNTTLIEAYTREETTIDVGDKNLPGNHRP